MNWHRENDIPFLLTNVATIPDPDNNRVWIFGGRDLKGNISNKIYYIYDPLGVAEVCGFMYMDMPEPLQDLGACKFENFIYTFGGFYRNPKENVWRYDINRREWEFITRMKAPLRSISTVVYQNKIYLFSSYSFNSKYYIFDPYAITFTETKELENNLDYVSAVMHSDNNKFIISGIRRTEQNSFNEIWYYYPDRDKWEKVMEVDKNDMFNVCITMYEYRNILHFIAGKGECCQMLKHIYSFDLINKKFIGKSKFDEISNLSLFKFCGSVQAICGTDIRRPVPNNYMKILFNEEYEKMLWECHKDPNSKLFKIIPELLSQIIENAYL